MRILLLTTLIAAAVLVPRNLDLSANVCHGSNCPLNGRCFTNIDCNQFMCRLSCTKISIIESVCLVPN